MTLTLIDKKSTLAKLLATENIEVQQNKVRTASFDVKNRVLTIPIFKHENKDVIDMGIRKGKITKQQAIEDLGMASEYR